MKLFISWSGERSKLLAESLRDWLPGVINAIEPWLSSYDIDPGARWGPALARQLENTKYGIICLTPENLTAPWILFEAGALSKYVDESRVVPLISDLKPTDIKGPLAQFQSLRVKENDIKILVTKINQAVIEAGEKSVDQGVIDRSFKLWWPELKEAIDAIPAVGKSVQKSERSEKEMIEEILTLVRANTQATAERQITSYFVDSPTQEWKNNIRSLYGSIPVETTEERLKRLGDVYRVIRALMLETQQRLENVDKGHPEKDPPEPEPPEPSPP